eukprot:6732800-Pyramimonas_sp.AAC.1
MYSKKASGADMTISRSARISRTCAGSARFRPWRAPRAIEAESSVDPRIPRGRSKVYVYAVCYSSVYSSDTDLHA